MITHKCGAVVVLTSRTVSTEPSDPTWPKNQPLELPYCPDCRRLVETSELRWNP